MDLIGIVGTTPSSTVYAADLADLADVYEPHVNVLVHPRSPDSELATFVRGPLLAHD